MMKNDKWCCAIFKITGKKKHVLHGTVSLADADLRIQQCPPQMLGQMLVVCFTNHALDQFLEGMMDFCPAEG